MSDTGSWPALAYQEWKDTLDTFHMWMQVIGKVKLELAPFLNEWWQVGFTVTARGLTTGTIPYDRRLFQVDLDLFDHRLDIHQSDGRSRSMALRPQTVADFFREFMDLLADLDVDVDITRQPVEVPNTIPFHQDYDHGSYDGEYVHRWLTVIQQTARLLESTRSSFFGKSSPVLFWWGSFDISQTRFSGRPGPKMDWPTRWMARSADQEAFSAGFWPGSEKYQAPAFFAYTFPEPPGIREAAIRPDAASFDETVGEFILPYDAVRESSDPDQAVLDFFQSAYEIGADLGNWDRAALERAG